MDQPTHWEHLVWTFTVSVSSDPLTYANSQEGNNASNISIIYFQINKLEHLYKGNASLVFVEDGGDLHALGRSHISEHDEIPRTYYWAF